MRRVAVALVVFAAGVTLAEPALGVHGHWPVGYSVVLGLAGCLLLVVFAKALADAGLQVSNADEDEDPKT